MDHSHVSKRLYALPSTSWNLNLCIWFNATGVHADPSDLAYNRCDTRAPSRSKLGTKIGIPVRLRISIRLGSPSSSRRHQVSAYRRSKIIMAVDARVSCIPENGMHSVNRVLVQKEGQFPLLDWPRY